MQKNFGWILSKKFCFLNFKFTEGLKLDFFTAVFGAT